MYKSLLIFLFIHDKTCGQSIPDHIWQCFLFMMHRYATNVAKFQHSDVAQYSENLT